MPSASSRSVMTPLIQYYDKTNQIHFAPPLIKSEACPCLTQSPLPSDPNPTSLPVLKTQLVNLAYLWYRFSGSRRLPPALGVPAAAVHKHIMGWATTGVHLAGIGPPLPSDRRYIYLRVVYLLPLDSPREGDGDGECAALHKGHEIVAEMKVQLDRSEPLKIANVGYRFKDNWTEWFVQQSGVYQPIHEEENLTIPFHDQSLLKPMQTFLKHFDLPEQIHLPLEQTLQHVLAELAKGRKLVMTLSAGRVEAEDRYAAKWKVVKIGLMSESAEMCAEVFVSVFLEPGGEVPSKLSNGKFTVAVRYPGDEGFWRQFEHGAQPPSLVCAVSV
jgi:hypothetical protein